MISDYLVLFAKWPLLGAIQQFYGLAEANDMIIKVKQQKDGLLSTQEFELLNQQMRLIYFVGNLEFDEKKTLLEVLKKIKARRLNILRIQNLL